MKKWTKEELQVLKENMDATLAKIQSLLPDKSPDDIVERIKLLYRVNPVNKYTEEELDIIRKNPRMSVFNLMKLLPNRSYDSIKGKVYTIHGYKRENPPKRWTPEEMNKVRELVNDGYTNYEIAEILGRPLNSVMGLLYTRKLTNTIRRRVFENRINWKKETIEKLSEYQKAGKTVEQISEILSVPVNKIYQKLLHLGHRAMDIKTDSKINRKTISELKQELRDKESTIQALQSVE